MRKKLRLLFCDVVTLIGLRTLFSVKVVYKVKGVGFRRAVTWHSDLQCQGEELAACIEKNMLENNANVLFFLF